MKIDLQPGDFARIKWNGNQYTKEQHYHVLEVLKTEIHVRVPGSYIKMKIKIKHIKDYEVLKIWSQKEKDVETIKNRLSLVDSIKMTKELEQKKKQEFAEQLWEKIGMDFLDGMEMAFWPAMNPYFEYSN